MTTEQILKSLYDCASECNRCFTACLNEEDVAMMARCIELDRDCADICLATASLFVRESEKTDRMLKLCADFCDSCAEECEKHELDHCRRCAEACRRCSENCAALA